MRWFSGFMILGFVAMGIARGEGAPKAATRPSTRPAALATRPSAALSAALPTAAGIARLRFKVDVGNQPMDLCVVVCVSKKVAAMPGRVPTMLYLGGMAD